MDDVLRKIAEDNNQDTRASLHMLHDFMRWRQQRINLEDERMYKSTAMEQYGFFLTYQAKINKGQDRMYSNLDE